MNRHEIIIHDYYAVHVEKLYESTTTKAGIITSAAEHYLSNEEDKETDDHMAHKRQYGTVITCPMKFTDEQIEVLDPGIPAPKKFISGDYLQMRANQGYSGYNKDKSYYPSTFEKYEVVTRKDLAEKISVKPGDKVYFDYKTTEPENLLGPHPDGGSIYRIAVEDIHCSVRYQRKVYGGGASVRPIIDNVAKIIPQGGWCMVEPHMETWEEITTKSGIIKKPRPEAKMLQGTVRHISKRPDLKAGDKVFFVRFADYVMTIEGVPYYVMREDDILTKF
jgi:co-chaperonin GroES (HSP10)